MEDQKRQLIDRLKQAQNVLVTVSANPSVDQLAAAIGLTLVMNHLEKHGTAVFSGQVPSTMEFLKPEETLEPNTDSLRDFIIALDKSKADKLRYKVEDEVVRIFITPYRSSIDQNDLEFSQGDFNVDVVVALGVRDQNDLDNAITAHGRILHDATVTSINIEPDSSLGTIQWTDPNASSLSEMVTHLATELDKSTLDNQTATALLTGIVAATERFRNDRTTPDTMNASAVLMAAGANQQLIATQLETPPKDERPADDDHHDDDAGNGDAPTDKPDPGTLEIDHDHDREAEPEPQPPEPPQHPQIEVDEEGRLIMPGQAPEPPVAPEAPAPELPRISNVHGAPHQELPHETADSEGTLDGVPRPTYAGSGMLSANTQADEDTDEPTEALTEPSANLPLLKHDEAVLPPMTPPALPSQPSAASALPPLSDATAPPVLPPAPLPPQPAAMPAPAPVAPVFVEPSPVNPAPAPQPFTPPAPVAPAMPPHEEIAPAPVITPDETLSEIEKQVHSKHLEPSEPLQDEKTDHAEVDDARQAVEAALSQSSDRPLEPVAALNAQPLGEPLHEHDQPAPPQPAAPVNAGFSESTPGNTPADEALDMPLPGTPLGPQPAAIQPLAPPTFPPQPASSAPAYQPPSSPFLPPVAPGMPAQAPQYGDPNAPPPVPPPMLPPLR